MSSRPVDWSAVGWDRDPTPGDPDAVAQLAARFRRTAEAIEDAANGLELIEGNESYKGEGGDALRRRTRDLAGHVREVQRRYEEAADALNGYHPEQYAAQRMADEALRLAESAQSQQVSASWTLSQIPAAPTDGATEDPQVSLYRSAAQRAGQEAAGLIAQAQTDVRRAHDWQDEAGRRAAGKLKDVIEHDGLSDRWQDDLTGNTVGRLSTAFVKQLAKWADRIAAAAGVLALVANVIPVIGQAVAVIAGAVAGLASVVSLLSHAILRARGEENWTGTALALLGVVTLGLGRAATASGKIAVSATRARAWTNVAKPKPLTAVGRRHGKTLSNYSQVKKLVGGPLGKGTKDALPLATPKGLGTVGRRALHPRTIAKDVWKGIRTTRNSRTTRREWARDLVRPWGKTFDQLGRIDPSLLGAKNIQENLALAEMYRRRAKVAGIGDRVVTGIGVGQEVRGLVRGEDPEGSLQPTPLPRDAIEAARLSDEDLEAVRNGALFAIRYRQHEIPRPGQGWPVPVLGLRQDPVRS